MCDFLNYEKYSLRNLVHSMKDDNTLYGISTSLVFAIPYYILLFYEIETSTTLPGKIKNDILNPGSFLYTIMVLSAFFIVIGVITQHRYNILNKFTLYLTKTLLQIFCLFFGYIVISCLILIFAKVHVIYATSLLTVYIFSLCALAMHTKIIEQEPIRATPPSMSAT